MNDLLVMARPYEFWFMVFATNFVFWSVILKTKWWRSPAGQNVFFLSLWFVLVMYLLTARLLGVFPDWLAGWDTLIVYGLGGLILTIRGLTLWIYNRGFWAWTKTEIEVDDGAR